MTVHLPVTLPNIEEIERGLSRSLDLFADAFAKIEDADAAIKRAHAAIEEVTPGASYHSEHDIRGIGDFYKAIRLPVRELYLGTARKLLTLRCWHYVVDRCGMQHLMDAQAKKELDAQLRYVPERSRDDRSLIDEEEIAKSAPPFTSENVRATMARFAADAQMIWRRGIANAFSGLDRRFRSHDGFKVGSRIILTRFANEHGSVDRYGRSSETFRDIERTFHILDGQDPRHARADFLFQINEERRCGLFDPRQSEHEHAYFKVRIFKNGNAHLWFTRDDLVELVNKELAAYYGEVIGDGQTKEDDPLESRALTPARLFGFYPTPKDLAERVAALIPFREGTQRILEPSAGTGNLIRAAMPSVEGWDGRNSHRLVDAIEIQAELAKRLRNWGDNRLRRVIEADFLIVTPGDTGLYDGVFMNPPFDRERDIDHVTHALKFLKPGGWLLSIMSAGIEFRETRKSAAFRKLLDARGGWMLDLPSGSFAEVGTYVNTVLVGIGVSRAWSI